MVDDAAVGETIDDAAVEAIAREFGIEDREQPRRCLEGAAAAYRENIPPVPGEGLREIMRFQAALKKAVASWNEMSHARRLGVARGGFGRCRLERCRDRRLP